MNTSSILQHIKAQGQVRDADIAHALGVGLSQVRKSLDDLSTRGDIACCSVTRYENGKPVHEILCRASGYIPRPAPGRKPKSNGA